MAVPSLLAWLRGAFFGHPRWVWLLWASAAAVLAACPMMLSDPAMWMYLLDPELLALLVIVGFQYTRWEAGLLRLRIRSWLSRPLNLPPLQGDRVRRGQGDGVGHGAGREERSYGRPS
jgi:hypothetical protein